MLTLFVLPAAKTCGSASYSTSQGGRSCHKRLLTETQVMRGSKLGPEGTAIEAGTVSFSKGDAQAHAGWRWSLDSGHTGSKLQAENGGLGNSCDQASLEEAVIIR